MHAKYIVIQLGYINQFSIYSIYVAIQLDQNLKLAEVLSPSTTGTHTPATSPNCL